ncbi:MAG: hypothetical protein V1936_04105 [Patescibacteria group bacterium]
MGILDIFRGPEAAQAKELTYELKTEVLRNLATSCQEKLAGIARQAEAKIAKESKPQKIVTHDILRSRSIPRPIGEDQLTIKLGFIKTEITKKIFEGVISPAELQAWLTRKGQNISVQELQQILSKKQPINQITLKEREAAKKNNIDVESEINFWVERVASSGVFEQLLNLK